jgi:hypothetical protein
VLDRDDHELLRLREQVVGVGNRLVALEWEVKDLREWRAEVRHLLSEIDRRLDGLTNAKEIADEVAKKMGTANKLRLTKMQTVIAALVMVATIAADIVRMAT